MSVRPKHSCLYTLIQNCLSFCKHYITFLYRCIVDTNECLQNLPCPPNASCNNTEGSYVCICDTGYDGDGFTCNGKYIEHNYSTEKQPWRNEAFQILLKFYYCFIDTNEYLKISPCHPNARSCHDLAMILLYYMS